MSTVTRDPPALLLRPQLDVMPAAVPRDEVSFKDLVSILWRARLSIALITLATGGLLLGLGFVIPKQYEAQVTLSPVADEMNVSGKLGAVSSLMSQLGVGGMLGSMTGGTRRAESLALLQSQMLTERYIRDNNLLPVLFDKKWDAAAGRWIPTDPEKIPALWDGNRAFKKIRQVADDPKSGLVKLTITWTDPKLAAKWANDLVQLTNDQARARTISEAQRNIAYLNEQAAKTSVSELKQAIYAMLEQEMKKEMLARGDDQYALRVIDPAEVPRRSSSPGKALWLAAGLAGGFLMAVLFTLMRASWNGAPSPRKDVALAGTVPFRR